MTELEAARAAAASHQTAAEARSREALELRQQLHAQKQAVRAAEGRLSRLPGSARALAERLSDLCEPIEAALRELNAAHAPSIERGDGSRAAPAAFV